MSNRIWNTPNQTDPWEAYAEWEKWFRDELTQTDFIIEYWEEKIVSWFKPLIFSVMCSLHDKQNQENERLKKALKEANETITQLYRLSDAEYPLKDYLITLETEK